MKKIFFNRKLVMISVLMVMLMMLTAVVYAAVIVVDGDPSDADWPAPITVDPEEANVPDQWDVRGVYATNSGLAATGEAFFMIQTQGAMDFSVGKFLYICIDTDDDVSTGVNAGFPSACTDEMNGLDRVIRVSENDPFSSRVYTCPTAGVCAISGVSPQFGYNSVNKTIEVSETLTNLGITVASSDGKCLPFVVYYDNDGLVDDAIPDTGTVCMPMGTGSPTAVSLQNVSANGTGSLPAVGLIAFALLAIVGTGVALTRRQRA